MFLNFLELCCILNTFKSFSQQQPQFIHVPNALSSDAIACCTTLSSRQSVAVLRFVFKIWPRPEVRSFLKHVLIVLVFSPTFFIKRVDKKECNFHLLYDQACMKHSLKILYMAVQSFVRLGEWDREDGNF